MSPSWATHRTRVGAWKSRGRWKQPVSVAIVAVRGDWAVIDAVSAAVAPPA